MPTVSRQAFSERFHRGNHHFVGESFAPETDIEVNPTTLSSARTRANRPLHEPGFAQFAGSIQP